MFGKKRSGIIDVHSHVLPALDDGSKSPEQSLEMLKIAQKEGISKIICTPHYKHGRRNPSLKTIAERTEALQRRADQAGIDIQLYLGNEVYYVEGAEDLIEEGRFFSMNGTRYVLVEFSPIDPYNRIRNAVMSVFGAGYTPVIAHVERYECVTADIEFAAKLKQMGAKIQVNAASLTGSLGKEIKQFSRKLLEEEIVDYIGTDAHNSERRAPNIQKCASMIYKHFEEDYADAVLFANAQRDFNIV